MLFRILRFIFVFALSVALVVMLSTSFSIKGNTLPPLGNFFNPFSGFWRNAEPITGKAMKDMSLPGLKGKVDVIYDDMMVPHIFAENMEDALMVQGYVCAQNRLWQMDIGSRKAAGRLSEVLGERTLEVDKTSRREGLLFAAENDLVGWKKSPEMMRLMEAYTAGVNAWINQLTPEDYPIEFKLLNYKPEPWNLLKMALITENMAKTLCSKEMDLQSTETRDLIGQAAFDYLYPEWNPSQTPVIPDTGQWKDIRLMPIPPSTQHPAVPETPKADVGFNEFRQDMMPYEKPIEGSNNFAVSGVKTASGKPILCNDPHLGLTLPSVWFTVQIHCPELNAYGVCLPGVPGIVIGFNENVAWGMTNVSHDVADWMKVKWTDAGRSKYLLDGKEVITTLKIEEIAIKGQASIKDTVRYTDWGPVTHDNDPKHPLHDYAYRWLAHDVPDRNPIEVFLGLNQAKDYNDYAAALPGYDVPAQNFIFASRSGDIAIRVQGKFPVRAPEQGRFLLDGSSWLNGWQNYIPQDQLPMMRNPSRGFVYSANQHSTPPSYPYYYLGEFEDDRSRRIFERLSAMQHVNADSLKSIQLDNFSHRASDALPLMLAFLDKSQLDGTGQQMVQELEKWNYYYDANTTTPTLFQTWFDSCYATTFDELYALEKKNEHILFPEAWRFISLLKSDTASLYFDHPATPNRETARDIAQESFSKMKKMYEMRPDLKKNWGAVKQAEIRHIANIPAFGRLDLNLGGHHNSPNAMQKTFGPSWRMIVELGDEVKAQGVYPGGQSGNPGSPYYDNMVDQWANGKYYDLLFMKKADEKSDRIKGKQSFNPKS